MYERNKIITVAGPLFIETEKKLDTSNIVIKGYQDYISANKVKNDILDKVGGDNVKNICSEEDDVYKNSSVNRDIKILSNNERELQ